MAAGPAGRESWHWDLYQDLFDADGAEIYLRPTAYCVKEGATTSFMTIVDAGTECGEIAIGSRLQAESGLKKKAFDVYVNRARMSRLPGVRATWSWSSQQMRACLRCDPVRHQWQETSFLADRRYELSMRSRALVRISDASCQSGGVACRHNCTGGERFRQRLLKRVKRVEDQRLSRKRSVEKNKCQFKQHWCLSSG